MRSFSFLSVFSSSEVLAKITSFRSKLPTAVCWSRGKKRGNCEANLLYVKSDSVSTTDTTDKSFTMFFAVEVLNLIVNSKSQPIDLDNSTIELHAPSRRKKSLQSYCSVDFDFLALMRFDMNFDATLLATQVLLNLQIRVIKNHSFSLLLVTFSIKANFEKEY